MPRISTFDVARAAGVSQATVSRTFSPRPEAPVAPETRARILAVAASLGYRHAAHRSGSPPGHGALPGPHVASWLSSDPVADTPGTTPQRIAVLTGPLDDPARAAALEAVVAVLRDAGRIARVILLGDAAGSLPSGIDGAIAVSSGEAETLAGACAAYGLPAVVLGRVPRDSPLDAVAPDDVDAGRQAAEHVAKLGCLRPALIAGLSASQSSAAREWGYRAGLAAAGLELFARGKGKFDPIDAAAAARALFDRSGPRPDALFVASDNMAMQAMDVLRFELGLAVPDEVAVVGFGDVPAAAAPAYGLTSFRLPLGDMAEMALQLIDRRAAAPQAPPLRLTLEVALVPRASSAGFRRSG